jgi:hypothetical protein
MNRTLFNKPIRKDVTDLFFPDKMTIEEFESIIIKPFQAYKDNMKGLAGKAIEDKYIEGWVEQYLGWLDIEQE